VKPARPRNDHLIQLLLLYLHPISLYPDHVEECIQAKKAVVAPAQQTVILFLAQVKAVSETAAMKNAKTML
jgi:hypothetical protein